MTNLELAIAFIKSADINIHIEDVREEHHDELINLAHQALESIDEAEEVFELEEYDCIIDYYVGTAKRHIYDTVKHEMNPYAIYKLTITPQV